MYICDSMTSKTSVDRFWIKVKKSDGCWIWGALRLNGYGCLRFNGKRTLAHRVSWEIHNGPIPEGLFVLHRCDNPACVRPDHLFLGTRKDNMQDMIKKGRRAPIRLLGEWNPQSKLTEASVKQIRSSNCSGIDLAKQFGVSQQLISEVKARLVWKHV